ncbi:MAG: enolase C-terminal domain-like protein [Bryobacteraceae bacterium]|jgi:mannonate dehydratase
MNRRQLIQTALASTPLIPQAAAQEAAKRTTGLPALTIKDAKVITTTAGGNYRWVFLKIETSEPGLFGIGSANNNYETKAVIAALEDHLKPWIVGKDPNRIEDLWQSAQMKTYWRNGPVNNNVLAAMDMALWDIKGKRAGMPVYDLLGGKAHDAVAVYDHQGGRTKEACLDTLQRSLANGFRHVRIQFGEGYGGGGFIAAGEGSRAEGGFQGLAFDEEQYVDVIPPIFEFLRSKAGFTAKLIHDVHSKMNGMNAVELARRLQPMQMYFVEDILPPEQISWYRNIRQICSTPQAIGEVFSHPFEVIPLIQDRLIDFIRCRVAAIGGITPLRKLVAMCELYGVKTAFQEGGENDPVNQMASYHIDLSSSAFGIQEENHFPQVVHDLFPGIGQIRKGYLYDSGKPGLGLEIDEAIAAKYPLGEIRGGGAYKTDRTIDGTVIKP